VRRAVVLELRDRDAPRGAASPQHALAGAWMVAAAALGIRSVSRSRGAVAVALRMHEDLTEVIRWL